MSEQRNYTAIRNHEPLDDDQESFAVGDDVSISEYDEQLEYVVDDPAGSFTTALQQFQQFPEREHSLGAEFDQRVCLPVSTITVHSSDSDQQSTDWYPDTEQEELLSELGSRSSSEHEAFRREDEFDRDLSERKAPDTFLRAERLETPGSNRRATLRQARRQVSPHHEHDCQEYRHKQQQRPGHLHEQFSLHHGNGRPQKAERQAFEQGSTSRPKSEEAALLNKEYHENRYHLYHDHNHGRHNQQQLQQLDEPECGPRTPAAGGSDIRRIASRELLASAASSNNKPLPSSPSTRTDRSPYGIPEPGQGQPPSPPLPPPPSSRAVCTNGRHHSARTAVTPLDRTIRAIHQQEVEENSTKHGYTMPTGRPPAAAHSRPASPTTVTASGRTVAVEEDEPVVGAAEQQRFAAACAGAARRSLNRHFEDAGPGGAASSCGGGEGPSGQGEGASGPPSTAAAWAEAHTSGWKHTQGFSSAVGRDTSHQHGRPSASRAAASDPWVNAALMATTAPLGSPPVAMQAALRTAAQNQTHFTGRHLTPSAESIQVQLIQPTAQRHNDLRWPSNQRPKSQDCEIASQIPPLSPYPPPTASFKHPYEAAACTSSSRFGSPVTGEAAAGNGAGMTPHESRGMSYNTVDDVATIARRQGCDLVAVADRLVSGWRGRCVAAEAAVMDLRLELRVAQRRLTQMDAGVAAAVAQRDAATAALEVAERRCSASEAHLTSERRRTDTAEQRAGAAETVLAQLQALSEQGLMRAEAEAARSRQEAAAARAEAAIATVHSQDLEREVARLTTTITAAEARAAESADSVRQLREEYDNARAGQQRALGAAAAEARAAVQRAEAAEAEAAALRGETAAAREQLAEVSRQLSVARAELAAGGRRVAAAAAGSNAAGALDGGEVSPAEPSLGQASPGTNGAGTAVPGGTAAASEGTAVRLRGGQMPWEATSAAETSLRALEGELAEATVRNAALQSQLESLGNQLMQAAREMSALHHRCETAEAAAAVVAAAVVGDSEAVAAMAATPVGFPLGIEVVPRLLQSGDVDRVAQPLESLEALTAMAEAALPRVRHALLAARVAAATRGQDASSDAAACAVCLAGDRDTFLNCGHIICRNCAERVERCPICRADITHRSRAFV